MCIEDWVDIENILKSKIFSYQNNNLIGHTLTRMFIYVIFLIEKTNLFYFIWKKYLFLVYVINLMLTF